MKTATKYRKRLIAFIFLYDAHIVMQTIGICPKLVWRIWRGETDAVPYSLAVRLTLYPLFTALILAI